jgi:cytochrome c peroxidase
MNRYIIFVVIAGAFIFLLASFNDKEPSNKAELGELLFFDPILSKDETISCASCHIPAFAFADTAVFSTGVGGKKGVRNSPSAMNLLLQRHFFWDGRAKTLEEQALEPISNPVEMNLPVEQAVQRLQADKRYNAYFRKFYNSEPTAKHLADAIASFERTLETSESDFDNWKYTDDPAAVSDDVKRGFEIFSSKGKCTECHFGSNFTQDEFKNIGLFNGKTLNDSGVAAITKKPEDLGKFKTPGLRNIAITAPYMHNGMLKTLREVIEFYNDPEKIVPDAINRDSILSKPLGLTEQNKSDLEAFLLSLTDKRFVRLKDFHRREREKLR